jgi:hypothetical protein
MSDRKTAKQAETSGCRAIYRREAGTWKIERQIDGERDAQRPRDEAAVIGQELREMIESKRWPEEIMPGRADFQVELRSVELV